MRPMKQISPNLSKMALTKSDLIDERFKALEGRIDDFVKIYDAKYEEMYKRMSLIIQEQRDEIVRLNKELRRTLDRERKRRAKAIAKFKSE